MNRKILKLAIPNIISNITIPLLGMADLAIVGHLDSNVFIGAIAIGSMIFNLIYWTFGFLRMGTSGITAQAFGARDYSEVMATLIRGLLVSLVVAFVILLFQVPIEKISFMLIDGSTEIETYARSYFYIRIWAAPATIAMYSLTGWFIGMQNTKLPMIIALLINALNIALNFLFVYIFNLKSDGVAWGTLIAQYSGLALAILFLYIYYNKYFKYIQKRIIFQRVAVKNFFNVNSNILIRTLCLLIVFTFFTSKSASDSDTILAANTLLLQFLFIFAFLTDGFAYAAEALTGKYYGAKQYPDLMKVIKLIFIWGAIISLAFTLIYIAGSDLLLRMLTNQPEVLLVAQEYKHWIILIPLVSVTSFIWDGIFIGLTASKQMRNSMLISVFLVFFPVWILLNPIYGNHALWLTFLLFFFTRGFSQTLIFQKMLGKIKKKQNF